MLSKPNNSNQVFETMKSYCKEKSFNFTDRELEYMAEDCYLLFESRGWKGITFWPAVVKRWVLNNISKRSPYTKGTSVPVKKPPVNGQTVRDRVLKQQEENRKSYDN